MTDKEKTEVLIDEKELMQWTTHPIKRRPWVALSVSLFILAVSVSVFMTMQSVIFGLFAIIVLFASVAKFYLPTTYGLSSHRVLIKSTTQTIVKEWTLFRSYYVDKNGVLLSPFASPSRLENFRGLYLIFNDNRDAVMACIKEHITTDESNVKQQLTEGSK